MKMTHSEWNERIRTGRKGKGRSQYYTATCPICLVSYDVDILGSDASARVLATQKVASHIGTAHKHQLSDDSTNRT